MKATTPRSGWLGRVARAVGSVSLLVTAASAQTAAAPTVRPRGPLRPFAIDMMAVQESGGAGAPRPPNRFHDALEEITWRGHPALKRTTATTAAGVTELVRWEIAIFDVNTLPPYHSEWHRQDGLFLTREFDGVRVTETRTATDVLRSPPVAPGTPRDPVRSDFTLSEPAYDWIGGEGLPILLGLPLRNGLDGSLPVITGGAGGSTPFGEGTASICTAGPCVVGRMTFHVSRPELITGLSGSPVRAWKIWVPDTRFTFWIAADAPAGPRLEQVTWSRDGATFSMRRIPPP
jgi:hypothetical protein